MQSKETIIAAHAFWRGMRIEFLPLLAESAEIECYGVGDLIFRERQTADHLYLLHRGQVALETFVPGKGMVTLQVLTPGEALGWSWFFPPYHWQFSARSIDATEVLAFGADTLRAKADQNSDFGRELVNRMAQVLLQRLQATRQKIEEFNYPSVSRRLDDCLADADEEAEPVAYTPG